MSDIEQLTTRFLEATVYEIGTDEESVYEILKEVNDNCLRTQFEHAVFVRLNGGGHGDFLSKGERYVVPLILKDEFSGYEFMKAMDRLDGLPDREMTVADEIDDVFLGLIDFFLPSAMEDATDKRVEDSVSRVSTCARESLQRFLSGIDIESIQKHLQSSDTAGR
jgi:hypothetical protein